LIGAKNLIASDGKGKAERGDVEQRSYEPTEVVAACRGWLDGTGCRLGLKI
jgi:hypothetical protein